MKLASSSLSIPCSVNALAWARNDLVDPTSGLIIRQDGTISDRQFLISFGFDRGLSLPTSGAFWTIAYLNRGTKAVLFKNWKEHREVNRSYYFAGTYDYPIQLAKLESGRVIIAHCPSSYDEIEIEDAETGECLGRKKTKQMEFHSRLSVSSDGRFLISAGWFWHPLGGAWLCPVTGIIKGESSANEVNFSFGAEIDSAQFLGNEHVVVASTDNIIDEETECLPHRLGRLQLGNWSISRSQWESVVPLAEPAGIIMPWREWAVSFHEHPKVIELRTGRILHRWESIYSGRQIGSIDLGDPPPPPIAMNPQVGKFAIATKKEVVIITLQAGE